MELMHKGKYITLIFLYVFVMLFLIVFPPMSDLIAFAESNDFDKTNVLDDLMSSTVNGASFSLSKYPYVGTDEKIYTLNFVEYMYSPRDAYRDKYALYVYVYNPSGKELDVKGGQNKISINCQSSYEKFTLSFCNKSTGDYENLFYKYRVIDRRINGKVMYDRVESHSRRYDIAEIELVSKGKKNATSYTVGVTYRFSGYTKGCGLDPNADSTLVMSKNELETIELNRANGSYDFSTGNLFDVTNFRAYGGENRGELNSIYFSIDNEIMQKYKKLQKIHAEWLQYETAPIIVTSDKRIYDDMLPYTGVNIGYHNDSMKTELYDKYITHEPSINLTVYNWSYNIKQYQSNVSISSASYSNILPYLFWTGSGYLNALNYTLSKDKLSEYVYKYNKSNNGYIDCNGRQISKDLFVGDTSFENSYKNLYVDTDDTADLLNLKSDDIKKTWLQKIFQQANPTYNGEDYNNIKPIYEMPKSYSFTDKVAVSKDLFVNENDIDNLKNFYNSACTSGKTVFLFRYASTNYMSKFLKVKGWGFTSIPDNSVYMAQETVFLDFDILDFTFNRDGELIVIPCAMSPIDIFNDVTAPIVPPDGNSFADILKLILMIIIAFVVIVVILPILSPILKIIVQALAFVISLPFKLIGSIFSRKSKR